MTTSAVEITSDLIQRLQKVRALTESSVPGEAAAAASKLQEILLKYNLDMEDIEEDSPDLQATGTSRKTSNLAQRPAT